jgi:hypothetical protein
LTILCGRCFIFAIALTTEPSSPSLQPHDRNLSVHTRGLRHCSALHDGQNRALSAGRAAGTPRERVVGIRLVHCRFHIFAKAAKAYATVCHGHRVSIEKSMRTRRESRWHRMVGNWKPLLNQLQRAQLNYCLLLLTLFQLNDS